MAIVSICSYKFSIFKIFIFLNWFMFIDRCSITKESFVNSLFARHRFIYATDLRFVSRCPKWRRSFRPKKPEMFQYAEASIVSVWYCQRDARQWTKRSPLKHGQTNMVFNWWLYFKRIKLLATVRIIVGVSFMICER